ncbi:MAG: hypothetical protein OXG35_07645 [Acidobacteria bacterium]|nr:hypothetical protein [Acidobacteriota bacterium]
MLTLLAVLSACSTSLTPATARSAGRERVRDTRLEIRTRLQQLVKVDLGREVRKIVGRDIGQS